MEYPKSVWWQCPLVGALIIGPVTVVSNSVIMSGILVGVPEGAVDAITLCTGGFCGVFYGIICATNRLQLLASALWSGLLWFAINLTMVTIAYRFLYKGRSWEGDLPYNVPMLITGVLTATGGGYLLALLVRVWNEEVARPRKASQPSGEAAGRVRPAVYEL